MGARRIVKKAPAVKVKRPSLPRWQWPQWLHRHLLVGASVVAVAAGLLGAGVWHLAQPDTLPIQRVQLEGEFHFLARQDLAAAMGELANRGFFNVDVEAIKRTLEAQPWVDTASVRRVWPDTLRVEIAEQVPLAQWNADQVVNVRGEVFAAADKPLPANLPRFVGPAGSAELLAQRYQAMSAQLAEADLMIAQLLLNQRRAWQVSLSNGVQLLFGRTANEEQLTRFVIAYASVLANKAQQIRLVDLRYTNGFAVRWKGADGARPNAKVG